MNVALRSERLNLISLCTGGGGLDLGIGLALPDAHSVVLVEREAFAVAELVAAIEASLMAPAAIWSDVRTFDGRPWRGLVDGLIGGIPCQPHSLAGKRLGEDDERDLWSDARRIIVQSRPWFVVIENVEGMLTSGGAERVVRDLRRLRYTVEIGLFSASETGATHQRNRVFIVAVADDANGRWRAEELAGRRGGRALEARGCGGELAHAECCGHEDLAELAAQGRQSNAGDGGGELDNAIGRRRQPRRHDHGSHERNVVDAAGQRVMVDASIDRRREGLTEPELRSGRDTAAGASDAMDDASRLGDRSVSIQQGQSGRSCPEAAGAGTVMGDAFGRGHDGRPHDAQRGSIERTIAEGSSRDGFPRLFPPGPSDLDGWRRVLEDSPHLEPAVRRMADGVAARLDLAGPHAARIERLRLLGNGVVPLEAAYAFRVLVSRLAAAGSAGAARLVQLMQSAVALMAATGE